jgi:hypothetical protein
MLLQARIELWYATIAWPIALTLSVLIAGQASAPLTVINEVELLVLDEELEDVADDWLDIELLGDVGFGLPGSGVVGVSGPVVGWGVATPFVPI